MRRQRQMGGAMWGVTLIELMIVIGILVVLSWLGIPQYNRHRHMQSARNCFSASKGLIDAQIMYFKDFSNYATALANLTQQNLPNANNQPARYFNPDRLIDNSPQGRIGPCRSVTFGAANSTHWSAVTVPKGQYGATGCAFNFVVNNHKINWTVFNCAGTDVLTVNDFKEIF